MNKRVYRSKPSSHKDRKMNTYTYNRVYKGNRTNHPDTINDVNLNQGYSKKSIANVNREKNISTKKLPPKKKRLIRKKRLKTLFIILPIVIVLLVLATIVISKVSITKNQASAVKNSLSNFLDCVQAKDTDGAQIALNETCDNTDILSDTLNNSFWTFMKKVPIVKKELTVADELIDVLYSAEDNLLQPLVDKMRDYPLTDLKVGDGFNTALINAYLDFLEEKEPFLEEILAKFDTIDMNSFVGKMLGNKVSSISDIADAYHEASALLPLFRVFIGDGSDRLYLLAAQNSAEIRASGGFPGSIGTIKIQNGILTIGEFSSVYDVLDGSINYRSGLNSEDYLFGTWIDAPRDACFIPDFKKIGQVWAVAYQDYQQAHPTEEGYDYDAFYNDYEEDEADSDNDVLKNNASGMVLKNENVVIDKYVLVGDPEGEEDGDNGDILADPEINEGDDANPDFGGDDNSDDLDNPDDSNNPIDPDANKDGSDEDADKDKDKDKEDPYEYGGIMYTGIFDGIDYDYNEDEMPYHVDGVVSLTPAIIQILLEDMGDIELFDGTILNGENATRVLQHELYMKYYSEDTYDSEYSGYFADMLFAETAKIAMAEFVSNFEISRFADYFNLFQRGADEHILNIWMADPEEEKIIEEAGVSGKLNDDPENPVAGVYVSLADPSKLGWYLDIIPEVSEPVINEDNSRTYDVKITLNDIMSDEEQKKICWYIIGAYNGDIRCFLHCFAPAGGTITDIETSNGMYMLEDVYHDLQVAYNLDVLIERGEPIEITYKITTAPGVETPLKVVTTPTLTEYRLPEDYGPINEGKDEWYDEESWY